MQGYPLMEFEHFRKKVTQCRKKTKGGTLWSRLYFWKHKKICGLVRESNPQYCKKVDHSE